MRGEWPKFRVRRSTVIIFWVAVILILLSVYFFYPSLYNQMRQVSYQNTPFVDTPLHP